MPEAHGSQAQQQQYQLDLGTARSVLAERSIATVAELQAENQRLATENERMAEFRRQFQQKAPGINRVLNEEYPQERAKRLAYEKENERLKKALEEAEERGFKPSTPINDPVLDELRQMREEMAAIKSRNQQPSLTLAQQQAGSQPSQPTTHHQNPQADPRQQALDYFESSFSELEKKVPGLSAHKEQLLNRWWEKGGYVEVALGTYLDELSSGNQQANLALAQERARNFPGVPGGGGSQLAQPGQVVVPGNPMNPQAGDFGGQGGGRPPGLEEVSRAHLAGQLTRLQQAQAAGY